MIEKHVLREHGDAGSTPVFPTNFRRRLREVVSELYPELAVLFIIFWMVIVAIAHYYCPPAHTQSGPSLTAKSTCLGDR